MWKKNKKFNVNYKKKKKKKQFSVISDARGK